MRASEVRDVAQQLAAELLRTRYRMLMCDIVNAETAGVSSVRWSHAKLHQSAIDALKLVGYKVYKKQLSYGATIHVRWKSPNPHAVPLFTRIFRRI